MSSDNEEVQGNADDVELAAEFKRIAREATGPAVTSPPEAERPDPEQANDIGTAEPEGEAPRPNDAAPPAEPAAEEISDEVWANAPPELRAAFEAERNERLKQENLVRRHNGRLALQNQELSKLRAAIASQRDPAGATPKGQEATNREDRMKQLREEYPELAEPILDYVANLETSVKRLEDAEAARATERTDQYMQAQEAILAERHPDWREQIAKPEFAAWRDSQPSYVQHAITHSVDGADTADILSRFKAETGDAASAFTARRAQQLQGGRSVPAKAPGVSAKSDDPQALWKQAVAERRALTR